MKTRLIVLSILMSGLSVNSQTILDTNIAGVNDTVINANDNFPSIVIGTSGTGKTWSFGGLLDNGRDTSFFLNPSAAPVGSSFSGANLALVNDTNYLFFSKTSSKLELIGISNGSVAVKAQDPETIITFPSSYNTSFMDSSKNILVLSRAQAQALISTPIPVSVDSIRIENNVFITSLMDASGTLTTPFGLFSALRQNLTRITRDDIYAKTILGWGSGPLLVQHDTAWSHQFWSNDAKAKFPLVSYDLNSFGTLSGSVAWITGYQPSSSISEILVESIRVYPNPVKDVLTLDLKENTNRVLVMDVTGKVVYINEVVKNNKLSVDFLQSGTYFLRIETDSFVGVSKFIKN